MFPVRSSRLQPGWSAERRWTRPGRVQEGWMVQNHQAGQALNLWEIFCCCCHQKVCFSPLHFSGGCSKQLNCTLTWRFVWGGVGSSASTGRSVKVSTLRWREGSYIILFESSHYAGLIKSHLFLNGLPITDLLITAFHYDPSCAVNITAFYKVILTDAVYCSDCCI